MNFKQKLKAELFERIKLVQIHTNKYQTIRGKKDSKLRKGKLLLVTGSCNAVKPFRGVFRSLSNIKDGAFCKDS